MATLRDYFVAEVDEHLRCFDDALRRGVSADIAELHRAMRGLRGTARIAREEQALRAATAVEQATRALADGRLQLDADVVDRLRASSDDLHALARGTPHADTLVEASVARWEDVGRSSPPPAPETGAAEAMGEFLEFAAREVVGIAQELESGVAMLQQQPMDREVLKGVLRRQRALLGSARLEEIPVLAETLRAVEDLSSVIAKLNVPVKHEWLDVFRCARDVLKSAAEPLQAGRQPDPNHALSRLRVLRQELLDRHGAGEAVSAVPGSSGLSQPAPAQPPAQPDTIDVRDLQYRGERAVTRAQELRPILERMIAAQRGGREVVEELYDLLNLARE
jgi:chemotaxis protein histidine kinase CheA